MPRGRPRINEVSFQMEVPKGLDDAIQEKLQEQTRLTGKNTFRNAWIRDILYKELNDTNK